MNVTPIGDPTVFRSKPSALPLKIYNPEPIAGPLSRQEKMQIICSVINGISREHFFCEKIINDRIVKCLKIAEEVL